MFKISIFYVHQRDARFDLDYYANVHMPRSIELLSAHEGYRGVSVERGVSGSLPESLPKFFVMTHFRFSTVEAFLEAFMPHAKELQDDIVNFTVVQPIIQFSEVLVESGAGPR